MKELENEGIQRVVGYLQGLAEGRRVTLPADGESLFAGGVLDSFGVLELAAFIEDEFEMRIPDEDLSADHFDSIAAIRAYLLKRTESS